MGFDFSQAFSTASSMLSSSGGANSAGSGSTQFDLSAMLGGGGGGQGSNLSAYVGTASQFVNSGAAGPGASDSLNSAMKYAGMGAALGSAFPGLGNVIGGAAGAIYGAVAPFLGGNPRVPFGAEKNAAAPHKATGQLDMTDFAEDNGNEYARWAIENGCTVEDIEHINKIDRDANGHSWETVVEWWRSHPEQVTSELKRIGAYGTFAGAGSAVAHAATLPAAGGGGGGTASLFNLSAPAATSPLFGGAQPAGNGFNVGDFFSTILNGAVKGAQTGAGTAAAGTPYGQQIKKDTLMEYLKEYQLLVAGSALGLAILVKRAFIDK